MMFEVKVNTSDLERVVTRMPAAVRTEVSDALDHVSRKYLKTFKAERLQGPPGVVGRPRGIFSQFRRENTATDKGSSVKIYTGSKIAKLHEEGGEVRAASGRLAVPLSARDSILKTSTGKLKKQYRNVGALKNVVPIRFGSQVFLTKIKKRTREVLPLFVLKNSVKIQPRLGFFDLWKRNEPAYYQILAKRLIKGIRNAWDGTNA